MLCRSIIEVISLEETSVLKLTFILDACPFFVVITITPLEPEVPYSEVAAAPLSTLILAMSSLFKSINLLETEVPAVEEPELRDSLLDLTPSITISAWLFPIIDVTPRTIILDPPPTDPEDRVI